MKPKFNPFGRRKPRTVRIASRAVRRFMERSRRDYRTYKNLTDAQLNAMMEKLPVVPPIWWTLDYGHTKGKVQRICFLIGAKTGRFFFLNDTGTGKTILTIALARYFRKLGTLDKMLVMVPARINMTEWEDQLKIHSPKTKYVVLNETSSEGKWQQLIENDDALFVFASVAGVMRMVTKLVQDKRRGKKTKNRLDFDDKKVKALLAHFNGLAIDESDTVKNIHKLPYRVARKLSKHVSICFLLTGTPFNRDPSEIWPQMYLVDHGATLGETMGLFRAGFFHIDEEKQFGTDYKFDRTKKNLLNQFLANRSISFEADAASLPPVMPVLKKVHFPQDAESYYQAAKRNLIEAHGNYEEQRNAFLRMRQISSGFVGYKDDETGERASLVFPDNPKLDSLLATCEAVRPDHKGIIFTEFTHSGERIVKELKEMGHGVVHLYGKTKTPEDVRDQFKHDKDTQWLVLQNAFGRGLNIQVAKYGLFYEAPVSAIVRKQCVRRVERQGSLHRTVFIYDYVVAGTVDEQILAFYKENADLFQALIRGKVKL